MFPALTPAQSQGNGYCGRCGAQVEHGDLRCAVCAWAVPRRAVQKTHQVLKVFRCRGCGAAMSWSAEKAAVACVFCGRSVALDEIVDPVEQTELWIPFRVDQELAQSTLWAWFKTLGWFYPNDLVSASTVNSIKAIWWPAWIFKARVRATWTADSDAGAVRSEWAPHSGATELEFQSILLGVSRGLTEAEMAALAKVYDLSSAVTSPDRGFDVFEETFDVQRSAARKRVAKACHQLAAAAIKRGHIPGEKYRNVKVSVVISDLMTRRVALPAWILAYGYRGELYRVVIHGQVPGHIVGTAPRSWLKSMVVVLVAAGLGGVLLFLLSRL